ncbi:MAG TPA: DUF6754 domain-containing protein [Anaerolineales bacterium]|jgi:hypothetical protein|nr:DUF6754 domain-containing protein [Anaerolineales bacterium]
MTLVNFIVVVTFAGLMVVIYLIIQQREERHLRDIPSFYRLKGTVELAVEDGTRIHVAIGRGDVLSPRGAAALVGLSMLREISMVASESDYPPLATAGDGLLGILAQDTMRSTARALNLTRTNADMGRVTGLTPFSYSAGVMPLIFDENVSSNLLIGSFSNEVALITSAGERSQTRTLAGTDNLPGQAILYATAHEPLVGEEMYAGGAYLGAGPMHEASLHTQDVIRWITIGLIIVFSITGLLKGLL